MTSLPHAWKLAGGEGLFWASPGFTAVMAAGVVAWGLVLLATQMEECLADFALYIALLGGWILTPRLTCTTGFWPGRCCLPPGNTARIVRDSP